MKVVLVKVSDAFVGLRETLPESSYERDPASE